MQLKNAAQAEAHAARRNVACTLGLAVLFPYFRAFFLSIVKTADVHGTAAFEGAFCAFAVTFALCAALALAVGQRLERLSSSRGALLATGALGALGTALLWAGGSGPAELVQCVAGAATNVVFFTVCLLRYVRELESWEARRATLVVTLAFGLCFASNLLYLLPEVLQAVACAACPLVAALCAPGVAGRAEGTANGRAQTHSADTAGRQGGLAAGAQDTARPTAIAGSPGAPGKAGGPDACGPRDHTSHGLPDPTPLALCVLLALFCIVGNFIRGVTNPWFDISDISIRTLYMSLINVALVAATVALLLKGASIDRVVFLNWVVYMLMFFGGVLAMAVAPADAAHMGSNLATSARVGFTMLLVIFVTSPGRWPGMPITRRAGLFLLVPEALAALVRYIAVPAYLTQAQGQRTVLVAYAGTAAVFILAAAIVIILGFLLLRSAEGATVPQQPAPNPQVDLTAAVAAQESLDALVVERLSERFGLTPREADVVRCASQGHSLEKTAELLGVSVNTVRTHNRSVYAKMGVHSRQEIIELAADVKAQLAEGR